MYIIQRNLTHQRGRMKNAFGKLMEEDGNGEMQVNYGD